MAGLRILVDKALRREAHTVLCFRLEAAPMTNDLQ